jgi:hypothetical protein
MNARSRSNQSNQKATPGSQTLPDLFTFCVLRFTQHATRNTQYVTLALALLAVTAQANNTENPYQGIVDRNVFGLRPPPPPPSNEPPKPPIPAINLTGITTILGKKMAFMTIQLPPKPGEQGKPNGPTSFMLSEGERDGEIEVVSIDENAGMVKVNDFGTITNVTFGKLPSTPAPAVAGGPGGIPSPNPIVAPVAGQRSIPGLPARTLRLGNNQAGMNNGTSPGLVNGQANPNIGLGQASGNGYIAQPQSDAAALAEQQAAANRSPEENVLLYEANRIKNEQLIQAGAKLPRMPQHPWLGGPQGQGQGQPQPQ